MQLLDSGEFAHVRAILEPYWLMFNFVLEYDTRPVTYALAPQKIWRNGPVVFVHYVWETSKATGAAAYPSWVSAPLRRASQKYNNCDYSIRLFLYYLSLRVRGMGAKIEWLTVRAKPRILFHLYGRPLTLRVRHSVFSITTVSGRGYIADFTIEQFGYPSSMWFMRMEECLVQCTTLEEMVQPCACEKDECDEKGGLGHGKRTGCRETLYESRLDMVEILG